MAISDKTTPAAIFDRTLTRIEQLLRRAKRPRAFKDDTTANALRSELFKLEGWAKLHRHWPIKKERKVFDQIHEQAKRLEDAFGALDVVRVIADDMRSKSQPDVAALFDDRAKKARNEIKHLLKHESWFVDDDGETRTEKMRRHLAAIDWPNPDVQFDYLCVALVRDLGDVSEKYRSLWKPELLKLTYDRKSIEAALHEWRRQLRWFSIYFQSADGLFALAPAPNVLTAEKKKLIADYTANPFAQLPSKRSTRVLIDRVAFYALTRTIEEIGIYKDSAERFFNVRDAMIKQGNTGEQATEFAKSLYGDAPSDVPVHALKLMAEFDRFKPLAYIAESLS